MLISETISQVAKMAITERKAFLDKWDIWAHQPDIGVPVQRAHV